MLGLFPQVKAKKQMQLKADMLTALLHMEARLGGELFGPVPKGGRREFFCLDPHTWVWHEEWIDSEGKHNAITTRYDVRPAGIVKSQGNRVYQALSRQELKNFYNAVLLYRERIGAELTRLANL